MRSVSFKGSIESSDKRGSQGSGSNSASVESLRSEYAEALSLTKDINAQILEAQKQNEKLEPQIEHYLKIANRPGAGFSDKATAMDKVKQLRAQQAARSRFVLPFALLPRSA
jgi:hypothetical protein